MYTFSICNSVKALHQCYIRTQNDSSQPLWVPKKMSPKMIKRGFFFCRFVNYYYRLIFAESRGQSLVLPWALHWSCLGGTYSAPKTPAKTDVPKFLLDATLYICFYIIEFAFIWTRMHSSDSLVSRHIFCFDC